MRCFRIVVMSIIVAVVILPVFSQSSVPGGIRNVFWQPNELQQGSVVFITMELERVPLQVTGKWIGKDLVVLQVRQSEDLACARGCRPGYATWNVRFKSPRSDG